jgi:hypothetical protein
MRPQAVVFILRVWPSQGAFKASVRTVNSEVVRCFKNPDALVRYLMQQTALHSNQNDQTTVLKPEENQ